MNPEVGGWLQACKGKSVQRDDVNNPILTLDKAIHLLLDKDDERRSLLHQRHTTHADAQLHCIVYIEMRKLVAEALRLSGV